MWIVEPIVILKYKKMTNPFFLTPWTVEIDDMDDMGDMGDTGDLGDMGDG